MKFLMIIIGIFSFSAMAQINDFECEKNYASDESIFIEVERPIFHNTSYRDIEVTSIKGVDTTREYYRNVWVRSRRLNTIIFSGSGMNLEIDTWLTNGRLVWGRSYPSIFSSIDFNNGREIRNLNCTYYGFLR